MRDLQADLEICNKATKGPWKSVRAAYEDCLVLNDDYSLSKHDIKFITASREGWPEAIERAIKAEAKFTECRKVVEVLQSEVERLRMALDKIANPLKYMQMEARAKGAELNGVYAIMLSKDPNYLKGIALAELDGKDINVPSKEGER